MSAVNEEVRGKTVAVTGATGFLGRYIVNVLLERGARVVGVVRNPDRVPELRQRGVELRRADLAEREQLARGFAAADAIVSNAALFSIKRLASLNWRNWEDHQQINVQGTQNVFDAAAEAGVKRIVHVSSVAVYRSRAGSVAEEAPQHANGSRPNPITAYAISKARSEQLAWQLAAQRRLQLTTVRPCAIYGAFDPNFTAVIKRILSLPISLFPTWLQLPLVYAGDVAEAIALVLERPVSIGKAYNLTGDPLDLWDFLRAWRHAGGRSPWLTIPVPLPVRQSFDHSRATRDLGWHNRSYVQALRETFAIESSSDGVIG
jgi:nucleoside-diphosphate-sugar epimerase